LAGLGKKILWLSGPIEGTWRRSGEGLGPYGEMRVQISLPLKKISGAGYYEASIPDNGAGCNYMEIEISNIGAVWAATPEVRAQWIKGFASVPGISIEVQESKYKNSPDNIRIRVIGSELPADISFKSTAAIIYSRIFKAPATFKINAEPLAVIK
jgi:hypothetical protein